MSVNRLIPDMPAPVLVAKGTHPHELAYTVPFDSFKLHVGAGTFTCCEFGHKMNGVDIPCDKIKIKAVMLEMMARKLAFVRKKAKSGKMAWDEYRQFRAYRENILMGLPREDGDLAGGGGIDADDLGPFLAAYAFTVADSETAEAAAVRHSVAARSTGWSPLRYAVIARVPGVVRTLLDLLLAEDGAEGRAKDHAREVDLECPLATSKWSIFRTLGMTILHEAMATSTIEIVEMLLAAGADPLRFTLEEGIGGVFDHPMDSLMMACINCRVDLVEWWGGRFPDWDTSRCDSDKHPFGVMFHAAHHGGKRCVAALMKYKSDNKLKVRWWDAVCGIINDESEPECFKVLVDHGYNANEPNLYPPGHPMGAMMDGMCKPMLATFRKDGTLPEGMMLMYGGAYNAPNVLFWCANVGNIECARIMVKAGADVGAKNGFDMTHVDLAEKMGHLPYVEYFRAHPQAEGPIRSASACRGAGAGARAGAGADALGVEEKTSDARFSHATSAASGKAARTSDARYTHAGSAAATAKTEAKEERD